MVLIAVVVVDGILMQADVDFDRAFPGAQIGAMHCCEHKTIVIECEPLLQ